MERNKQHLRIERKHPRVETGIHCVAGLPDSDLSSGEICDISVGGLKFTCGRHTLHKILPASKRTPGPVAGVTIEIHFDLPLPDKETLPVKCNARMVHFVRFAQDDFHVGVQFVRMDKIIKHALLAYLDSVSEQSDT